MQQRFIDLHPRTKNKLYLMQLESAKDGSYRVSRRIHAVLLNNEKHTSSEIAKIVDASREEVSEWLKIYSHQGIEGLMEGQRTGRPTRISDVDKIILCDIIDSGPIAYGYQTGVWTSSVIAEVIKYEFGITYHPGHVRKLLQDFGFSVQSPTRLLAAADKEKKDRWVSISYPNLKKRPAKMVAK
jgi:transposase